MESPKSLWREAVLLTESNWPSFPKAPALFIAVALFIALVLFEYLISPVVYFFIETLPEYRRNRIKSEK